MDLSEILVPANRAGKPTDLKFSRTFPDRYTALEGFRRAKMRLLNPDIWHELAGWATARFAPFDEAGLPLQRLIAAGDFLRIDIPGPGPKAGEGFDWVTVQQIEDRSDPAANEEGFGLTLRPSAGPGKGTSTVAHFFRDDATSSYIVERVGDELVTYYYGRNELPNTKTDSTMDNIRNSVVALGAAASLSEIQWTALCKGLLAEEIGG
jgi:hypothetical protein